MLEPLFFGLASPADRPRRAAHRRPLRSARTRPAQAAVPGRHAAEADRAVWERAVPCDDRPVRMPWAMLSGGGEFEDFATRSPWRPATVARASWSAGRSGARRPVPDRPTATPVIARPWCPVGSGSARSRCWAQDEIDSRRFSDDRDDVTQDYGLTGSAKQPAFDAGLANAEWFQPVIDPARLRELQARTDARASFDTLLWIALLVGSGVLGVPEVWSWWSIPAFLVYGALFGGAADPRWHEMGHGTAFRTRGSTTRSTRSPRRCCSAARPCGAGRTTATTPTRSSSAATPRSPSSARRTCSARRCSSPARAHGRCSCDW